MTLSRTSIRSFSSELAQIASEEAEPRIDPAQIRRDMALFRKIKKRAPGEVRISDEANEYGGGFYDTGDDSITLSHKDYESLAHEIGHAELNKRFLGRTAQHPVLRNLFGFTPIATALAGILAAKGKKRGLLLPALTAGPTLGTEAVATRKGRKLLEEAGAAPDQLEGYDERLRDSYRTYSSILPESAVAGALAYGVSNI